jgi:multidrug efflux pump subunit AcrA (membrane-fusion protein)
MVAGDDGRAHSKAVKVGIRQGDRVQIVEGLKEGEQVVAAGAYGLPDSAKIKLEAAAAAPEK